jgi:hypothetical protein
MANSLWGTAVPWQAFWVLFAAETAVPEQASIDCDTQDE